MLTYQFVVTTTAFKFKSPKCKYLNKKIERIRVILNLTLCPDYRVRIQIMAVKTRESSHNVEKAGIVN